MNTLVAWLEQQHVICSISLRPMDVYVSSNWYFNGHALRRHDGSFFGLVGVELDLSLPGTTSNTRQLLIDQPEIGILGYLLSPGSNGMQILVQCKAEPGNTPYSQLAPSVQATVSNYQRKHGGQPTQFLEFFLTQSQYAPVSDVRQSEQGTRFWGKYNRNMTVVLPHASRPQETEHIRWFALSELLDLLVTDFVINTDARSVLACTPWAVLAENGVPFSRKRSQAWGELLWQAYHAADAKVSVEATLGFLQEQRRQLGFTAREVAISSLPDWTIFSQGLRHVHRPMVIQHYQVQAPGREVEQWDQPLWCNEAESHSVLLCQQRQGKLQFLFTSRAEPGFRECVQFGPSVQVQGEGHDWLAPSLQTHEAELSRLCERAESVMQCRQSDEGGRFYRCITRYEIKRLPDGLTTHTEKHSCWLSLPQIEQLLTIPGVFTNEARTLISMLLTHV